MPNPFDRSSTSSPPDRTGYNEQYVANANPVIRGSATYGLIPANFRQFTASGGSTGTEGRLFKISTGASAGGYGAIQTFRSIPHAEGNAVETRFSGYFANSAASSWQGIGLISIGDELSFGYDGLDFGVWHRYGGLDGIYSDTAENEALRINLSSAVNVGGRITYMEV